MCDFLAVIYSSFAIDLGPIHTTMESFESDAQSHWLAFRQHHVHTMNPKSQTKTILTHTRYVLIHCMLKQQSGDAFCETNLYTPFDPLHTGIV